MDIHIYIYIYIVSVASAGAREGIPGGVVRARPMEKGGLGIPDTVGSRTKGPDFRGGLKQTLRFLGP